MLVARVELPPLAVLVAGVRQIMAIVAQALLVKALLVEALGEPQTTTPAEAEGVLVQLVKPLQTVMQKAVLAV
jgi:hypothetical protein